MTAIEKIWIYYLINKLIKIFTLKTGLKPHVCSFCAKAFTSIVSLNSHEQRYHIEDHGSVIKSDILCIFSCLTCEKVFKSKSTLRDHEIRNHGRKGEIFKCEFEGCVKDFTNPALLRNHMRTHTDERPFSCLYCNCNFKAKFHMENHSKRHTKTEGKWRPFLLKYDFAFWVTSIGKIWSKIDRMNNWIRKDQIVPREQPIKIKK